MTEQTENATRLARPLILIEQFDFLRSADNGCSLRLAADSDLEGVIAFGQIGGQDEIRREEEA